MSLSININDSDEITLKNVNRRSSNTSDNNGKHPKKLRRRLLLIIPVILLIVAILSFGKIMGYTKDLGLRISAGDIINPIKKDPELRTDVSGLRTNVMLIGIDTRDTNQGLQNTDSIIVVSYNQQRKDATMISIPRDTYVEIPGADWNVKINGIYNRAENDKEGSGLEALKTVVEDYTGLEIQYYAMVDIHGLTDIIDIMGGIEVYVENSFTDYAYPDENNPYSDYQVVSFEQGPQLMDGDTAVKFSRSRKSLDNNEGTDFARARRQQKVIEAIKEKALSTETFLNPEKLYSILSELRDHVKISEFTNEDVQAGLQLARNSVDVETYSFVLDPSVAGGKILVTDQIPEAYSISPAAGLGDYTDVNALIAEFLEEPELYSENAIIYVYDIGRGYQEAYDATIELQERFPYLSILYRGTLYTDKSGNYIYDNSGEVEFNITTSRLTTIIGGENTKPEFITNRLNGEDVTVLLGIEPIAEEIGGEGN